LEKEQGHISFTRPKTSLSCRTQNAERRTQNAERRTQNAGAPVALALIAGLVACDRAMAQSPYIPPDIFGDAH
jgi:hypothetical protein